MGLHSLNEIFERNVECVLVAEPLLSFDEHTSVKDVKRVIAGKGFDYVGVRTGGVLSKYAIAADLVEGNELAKHALPLDPTAVVDAFTPLLGIAKKLSGKDGDARESVFVSLNGKVWGIVNLADMTKIPARIWLFGLVSLLEMALSELVLSLLNDDIEELKSALKASRLAAAEGIFEERQKTRTEITLFECLQFCDKRDLITAKLGTKKISHAFGKSKKQFESEMKSLETMRNDLAHAQNYGQMVREYLLLAETAEGYIQSIDRLLEEMGN